MIPSPQIISELPSYSIQTTTSAPRNYQLTSIDISRGYLQHSSHTNAYNRIYLPEPSLSSSFVSTQYQQARQNEKNYQDDRLNTVNGTNVNINGNASICNKLNSVPVHNTQNNITFKVKDGLYLAASVQAFQDEQFMLLNWIESVVVYEHIPGCFLQQYKQLYKSGSESDRKNWEISRQLTKEQTDTSDDNLNDNDNQQQQIQYFHTGPQLFIAKRNNQQSNYLINNESNWKEGNASDAQTKLRLSSKSSFSYSQLNQLFSFIDQSQQSGSSCMLLMMLMDIGGPFTNRNKTYSGNNSDVNGNEIEKSSNINSNKSTTVNNNNENNEKQSSCFVAPTPLSCQQIGQVFGIACAYFIRTYKWSLYKTLEYMNSRVKGIRITEVVYNFLVDFERQYIEMGKRENETAILSYDWKTWQSEQDRLLRNTFLNANNIVIEATQHQSSGKELQQRKVCRNGEVLDLTSKKFERAINPSIKNSIFINSSDKENIDQAFASSSSNQITDIKQSPSADVNALNDAPGSALVLKSILKQQSKDKEARRDSKRKNSATIQLSPYKNKEKEHSKMNQAPFPNPNPNHSKTPPHIRFSQVRQIESSSAISQIQQIILSHQKLDSQKRPSKESAVNQKTVSAFTIQKEEAQAATKRYDKQGRCIYTCSIPEAQNSAGSSLASTQRHRPIHISSLNQIKMVESSRHHHQPQQLQRQRKDYENGNDSNEVLYELRQELRQDRQQKQRDQYLDKSEGNNRRNTDCEGASQFFAEQEQLEQVLVPLSQLAAYKRNNNNKINKETYNKSKKISDIQYQYPQPKPRSQRTRQQFQRIPLSVRRIVDDFRQTTKSRSNKDGDSYGVVKNEGNGSINNKSYTNNNVNSNANANRKINNVNKNQSNVTSLNPLSQNNKGMNKHKSHYNTNFGMTDGDMADKDRSNDRINVQDSNSNYLTRTITASSKDINISDIVSKLKDEMPLSNQKQLQPQKHQLKQQSQQQTYQQQDIHKAAANDIFCVRSCMDTIQQEVGDEKNHSFDHNNILSRGSRNHHNNGNNESIHSQSQSQSRSSQPNFQQLNHLITESFSDRLDRLKNKSSLDKLMSKQLQQRSFNNNNKSAFLNNKKRAKTLQNTQNLDSDSYTRVFNNLKGRARNRSTSAAADSPKKLSHPYAQSPPAKKGISILGTKRSITQLNEYVHRKTSFTEMKLTESSKKKAKKFAQNQGNSRNAGNRNGRRMSPLINKLKQQPQLQIQTTAKQQNLLQKKK